MDIELSIKQHPDLNSTQLAQLLAYGVTGERHSVYVAVLRKIKRIKGEQK